MSAQGCKVGVEWNKFYFEYDDHHNAGKSQRQTLEYSVNERLRRLIELGPPEAKGIGWVERTANIHCAKLFIKSPFRDFHAVATGLNPETAINRAFEYAEEQIFNWRFGNGSGHSSSIGCGPGTIPAKSGSIPSARSRSRSFLRSSSRKERFSCFSC